MLAVSFRDLDIGQVFEYSGIAYRKVFEGRDPHAGAFNAREVNHYDAVKYFTPFTTVYVH
jgi:hypothetical protein